MSKQRYTNMLVLQPVIEQMSEAGMSHRQIEDELKPEDRPVHNLLKRQRRADRPNAKRVIYISCIRFCNHGRIRNKIGVAPLTLCHSA